MLVPPPPSPPLPPPHANTPPVRATRNASIPSIMRSLVRRFGIPRSIRQARVAPPVAYHGAPGRLGSPRVALDAAVVLTESVAVPVVVSVILTGLVEPKLNVGRYWAPDGLEVIAAAKTTLPVKPPSGVNVMVDVFPLVAPRAMETPVPLSERLWTEIGAVPEFALKSLSPE